MHQLEVPPVLDAAALLARQRVRPALVVPLGRSAVSVAGPSRGQVLPLDREEVLPRVKFLFSRVLHSRPSRWGSNTSLERPPG